MTMMEQYLQIKEKYPHCLVLFRLGDFYELFYKDAEVAAEVLGIALTSRNSDGKKVPMCGIPRHALPVYAAKLTGAGHKAAVCEQVEGAPAGGLVPREVVRVITPGTLLCEGELTAGRSNYIVCVLEEGKNTGISAADISTGEFFTYSLQKGTFAIEDELQRINPSEVLTDKEVKTDLETARNVLLAHFNVKSLQGLGIEDDNAAILAAGGLLSYIRETQKAKPSHITSLQLYKSAEYLSIDSFSRKNLELDKNLRDGGKEGSLLWVLDSTVTAMGVRTLRRWVLEPLAAIGKIEMRLQAVEELKENKEIRREIRECLKEIPDIGRIISRITYNRATERDLQALRRGLSFLPDIASLLAYSRSSFLAFFRDEMDCLCDIAGLLQDALSEGGTIREGYSPELDECREAASAAYQKFEKLETREKQTLGIKTLKIGRSKVFGCYIEVTNSFVHMVPPHYKRVQTLSGRERYTTHELKELEERLHMAADRLHALEQALLGEITAVIGLHSKRILHTGNCLAVLDCLQSLALAAEKHNYVRPKLNSQGCMEVINGRHPVVERASPGFVPNHIAMSMETERILTITGPNMAGKSTFMRQTALLLVLSQMGSFVPADYADIGIADRLFLRVGAADDLARGQSTFMAEMTEISVILNNASKNSFIILDEAGRGTSTYDGMSIAWAVLEYIARDIGARTLFATHYHELTSLEGRLPGIVNYHAVTAETDKDAVKFTYKIKRGFGGKSYGIHAARLAGLPPAVTDRALQIMNELDSKPGIGEMVVYGTNRRVGDEGNRMTIQEKRAGAE